VDAVALDRAINTVLAGTIAFIALIAQNGELADDVTEDDGAIAGHHNHPSTRNACSICAVAISNGR
jgi:hypothetical protein